jgi:peptide/nickel transport system substrate-binding protein
MCWRRARGAVAVAAVAALLGAGCGDDDEGAGAAPSGGVGPGANALVYALASRASEIDPLLATARSEQLVTRQVHEPLVESLAGPFGDARRRRGLAREWRASGDREIWRFELRRGVRFQDGTPFNATAVLANVERWRTTSAGRALLPELAAADAPRPDLVRFILSRAVTDLPRRLASPRLGIVSPAALRPHSGRAAELARTDRTGTGPFELRERDAERVVIARNVGWWGTGLELGPALDQVEFRIAPRDPERLAMLRRGTVEVADSLPRLAIREIRRDPLLTYARGGGGVLGIERSVRGIDSAAAVEPLSEVWLTTVGGE